MIELKAFRVKPWVAFGLWSNLCEDCGNIFTIKKSWARSVWVDAGKKGKTGQKAIGKRSRRTKRSWSLSGTAVTCALKVY